MDARRDGQQTAADDDEQVAMASYDVYHRWSFAAWSVRLLGAWNRLHEGLWKLGWRPERDPGDESQQDRP